MLPTVDGLFTLVRQLATRSPLTEIAVPKWLVQRHALGPLVARAGITQFRDDLARASLRWAETQTLLPTLTRALTLAGVPVVPLKGASYATTLYDMPAERPMTDVDLLVPGAAVEAARRVLRGLGFLPFEQGPVLHHAQAWARQDVAIDLHWNIIAPGRSRINLAAVWGRTTPATWPEGAASLDAEDALVFHAIHTVRNRLRLPLIHVVDLERLLERADLTVAYTRARQWGLATAFGLALEYHRALLEERAWPRLAPSPSDAVLLAEPSALAKIAFDLSVAGSPRQLVARTLHAGANAVRALSSR
jgi:hypothetical protein